MASLNEPTQAERIRFTTDKLAEIRYENPNLTLIEQMRKLVAAYKIYIETPLPTSSMKRRPTTPTNSPCGKRMRLRSDDEMDVDS